MLLVPSVTRTCLPEPPVSHLNFFIPEQCNYFNFPQSSTNLDNIVYWCAICRFFFCCRVMSAVPRPKASSQRSRKAGSGLSAGPQGTHSSRPPSKGSGRTKRPHQTKPSNDVLRAKEVKYRWGPRSLTIDNSHSSMSAIVACLRKGC